MDVRGIFVNRKRIKYSFYSTVSVLVFGGILLVVNMIFQTLNWQVDLTRNQVFSLSPYSRQLVEGLEDPVMLYALYETGKENSQVIKILGQYEDLGDKVRFEVVDPDLDPLFTAGYSGESLSLGSLIVEGGGRYQIITPTEQFNYGQNPQTGRREILGNSIEQKVTAALQYVTTGRKLRVGEVSGHSERTITGNGALVVLKEALENNHYKLDDISLMNKGALSSQWDVIILNGPQFDLQPQEVELLLEFSRQGGALLVLYENQLNLDSLPRFQGLLRSLGVELINGLVIEKDNRRMYAGENSLFFSPAMEDHPLLENLQENGVNPFVANATAVNPSSIMGGHLKYTSLLTSSEVSYLKEAPIEGGAAMTDEDISGPVTVAAAVEQIRGENRARTVVISSSQMLLPLDNNPRNLIKGNVDFVLSSLAWLSETEEYITVPSKSTFMAKLEISAYRVYLYAALVILLIPGMVFSLGLAVYIRRRNQ